MSTDPSLVTCRIPECSATTITSPLTGVHGKLSHLPANHRHHCHRHQAARRRKFSGIKGTENENGNQAERWVLGGCRGLRQSEDQTSRPVRAEAGEATCPAPPRPPYWPLSSQQTPFQQHRSHTVRENWGRGLGRTGSETAPHPLGLHQMYTAYRPHPEVTKGHFQRHSLARPRAHRLGAPDLSPQHLARSIHSCHLHPPPPLCTVSWARGWAPSPEDPAHSPPAVPCPRGKGLTGPPSSRPHEGRGAVSQGPFSRGGPLHHVHKEAVCRRAHRQEEYDDSNVNRLSRSSGRCVYQERRNLQGGD